MNTETEQGSRKETPMLRVWMLVLSSMLIVGAISFIWYSTMIAKEKSENKKEEEVVQQSIANIAAYRDTLKASTSAASGK